MPRMDGKRSALLQLPEKHTWPAETAGHRMTLRVPVVSADQTIAQAQAMVFGSIADFRSVDYLYVVDGKGRFAGVLSIKDLYTKPKASHIGNICKRTSLIHIKPEAHQERAVYLAIKNNIKAMPVVDEKRRLIGVITNDTILTILHHEAHGDLMRLAGVHPHALHQSTLDTPLIVSFRHRFPWLVLGMIGGLLSAMMIGLFGGILRENLILAAFIPLIVYMSSAVGMQMQASVIRDLALDDTFSFRHYFLRQALVTSFIAVCCSVMLSAAVTMLHEDPAIGAVTGIALFFAIHSSIFTGLLIPYVFSRLKLDPADASGPMATVVQDLVSVTIYLGIAQWLL